MEAHESWTLEQALLEFLESHWDQPDEGIWEVRGPRRHFTHSKIMSWVAFDRAIKAVEWFAHDGPVERWRKIRDELHEQVLAHGYNRSIDSFTQSYGSDYVDASLLLIPLVGFLPATDPRVRGTVRAVERQLMRDGLVSRYVIDPSVDGLAGGEGAFLACSFWYVDNLVLQGRHSEARALFERLLGLRNDVGLMAEEYDTALKRQVGNFPQAFSHLALINTAHALSSPDETPLVRSTGSAGLRASD
jgi:GH15 family glucan-1,4-alpha-glucosidase